MPNPHRKSHRNVLKVFDVCLEMQRDCKNYFGFVVEEFSELFDSWAFCLLETVTGGVITQELRERGNFGMYKLGEFVHYKSKIALYFRTNIKYSQHVSMRLSVGNSAFSLFETLAGSRVKKDACDFMVRTSLENSPTTNPL